MSARTRRARLAGLAAVVALTSAPASAAPDQAVPVADRAFTVIAEAYPFEPAPGSQDEPVSVRPNSTKVQLSNPPANAYARAAATDFGLAEGYVGAQGPQVEADTSIEGSPHEASVDQGVSLDVVVTRDPSGLATATGGDGPSGSGRSRSFGSGDGVLVAEASASVQDVVLGPLLIGSGTYRARVEIDGTPGGASAEGEIVLSNTTVNDVPVIIGPTGLRADETKIPVDQVEQATAQVQEWFSQGGYADIRLVQPKTEVSEDGTYARSSGGGVYTFFTNNDPTNFYFLSISLLGGKAEVTLGSEFDTVGPPVIAPTTTAPAGTPATTAPSSTGGGVPATRPPTTRIATVPNPITSPSPGSDTGPAAGDTGSGDATVALAYDAIDQTLELPAIWRWWWLVVLAGAALVGGLAAARRDERLRAAMERFLDGYVRG